MFEQIILFIIVTQIKSNKNREIQNYPQQEHWKWHKRIIK